MYLRIGVISSSPKLVVLQLGNGWTLNKVTPRSTFLESRVVRREVVTSEVRTIKPLPFCPNSSLPSLSLSFSLSALLKCPNNSLEYLISCNLTWCQTIAENNILSSGWITQVLQLQVGLHAGQSFMYYSKYDVMEERWIQYYSSSHKILLVGEGDFSFSASLAVAFGSATNMVATSLDSTDVVISKYKEAKSNLENLEKLGACVLHGIDATKMKLHTDFQMRKFDRIIYNFPHAGFHGKEEDVHMINMHKNLVHGFFGNASGMLHANGEIHVNHKTTAPFCHWNLEEVASWNSLALIECVNFKRENYPGYKNKRGAGSRCDEPFPLGECSTFKFRFSPTAKKMFRAKNHQLGLTRRSQQFEEIPIPMQRPPTSLGFRYPQLNFTANMNDVARYAGPPSTINISNDCSRIFHGYFNHVVDTFGRTDYNVGYSVHEALRVGFERYMAEAPGRTLNGYIYVLHELHRLSILRSAWLRRMLSGPDHQL